MVAVQAAAAPRRGATGGAVCPNLLQRPGSSRGAREETLIFRASSRGRSRRGAPLQQIWTRSRPGSFQNPHPPHRVKGFTPGRTGTGGGGGAGVAVPPVRPGAHRNRAVLRPDARRERPIVLAGIRIQRDPRGQGFPPRPRGPLSSRGSAPGFPIPGELPPSPERPASGSLRPSAVSARTRSSGSPTLASPPVRRQLLCNPTTLNTHPPIAWETSANSTPTRRCCACCT